jgi:hypothetical protein
LFYENERRRLTTRATYTLIYLILRTNQSSSYQPQRDFIILINQIYAAGFDGSIIIDKI